MRGTAARQQSGEGRVNMSGDFVPGVMRCAKCNFVLHRVNLHVFSGGFSAGDNKSAPCPNGCGPLWPMTWRQQAEELQERGEELLARAVAAETRAGGLTRIYDVLAGINDAVEIGDDGCARFGSINDADRFRAIVQELEPAALDHHAHCPPQTRVEGEKA